jgi:hypothetical protein
VPVEPERALIQKMKTEPFQVKMAAAEFGIVPEEIIESAKQPFRASARSVVAQWVVRK